MKKRNHRTRILFCSFLAIFLLGGLIVTHASQRSRSNDKKRAAAAASRKLSARKNRSARRAAKTEPSIARDDRDLAVIPRSGPIGAGAFPPDQADGLDAFSFSPDTIASVTLSKLGARGAEPNDEPEEAMKFYLQKRLPEGERDLPVERYLEAKEQMELMPQYSTALGTLLPSRAALAANPEQQKLGTWTALGPGNVGGRTRGLLVNPQDPNVIYAAGVAGGVWKTTNAGASWTPLADMLPNIAVNSMAFDPANPNTIYAGTGEGYFNVDAVRGAGIFKTTDGGTTWTRLAGTANPDFYYVNDIVVSKNDGKQVYAATRTGVWRSVDGGDNWTRGLSVTVNGGCLDLAMRTDQTTDYIFTSCGNFQQAAIYRNTDASGGGSWDSVFTEAGMGRTALAIAPSNQSVIYALSASIASGTYLDGLHAVFRSTASGDSGSWAARARNTDAQKINTALLSNPLLLFQTDCRIGTGNAFLNQGWYDNVIAVDPADPNRVWAGGIDLFRSDDGGANWGVASYWWAGPPNEVTPAGAYAHADNHIIVFHPQYNGASNQTMFVGSDGGVFRTDNALAPVAPGNTGPCDPANSQVKFIALNNNYGVTQFYHGSVAPDGKSYYGGTQDNGTVRGTDAGGANAWTPINGGDGGYTALDPANPDTLFAAFTGISFRKSTDSGVTFSPATFGIADGGSFINPYIIDPSDAQRMWTGGTTGIWRTNNGAAQWARASSTITSGGGTSALAIAPTDANYALVGRSNGDILRSSAALTADSFTIWLLTRPRNGVVSWVTFDPANRDIAYATYSTFGGAHVWRSINGGATWTSIDGSGATAIPDVPVHCIAVDPSSTSRLYAGTDLGVFVSTDGGASWSVENTGFANVVTETLAANVAGGVTTLYAFTHGRGAFKVTANMSGCNYAISPATRRFGRDGGDAVVNVTVAPQGCNWRAESNASWITVAPNSGGSSNGSAALKVAANNSLGMRAGTVNIAGRSFSVIQEGLPDDAAPAIAITSPATPVVTTTSGSINVTGTASDNVRVSSVAWRTDRGATAAAAGTTAWTATNIPLATGRNVITFTAADNSGNISTASVTVNTMPASLLTTAAGTGLLGFSGDNGAAAAANISRPVKLAYDSAGNLYFADFNNHRVRRVAPNGTITTVAGNGTPGFSGDGGTATQAQLNFPLGVAIDKDGNLFISEQNNHRVRKVTAATGVITTAAGSGTAGFGGDGGAATSAQLNQPADVAVDNAGNLYIADFNNSRIRRVAANGVITTFAGTGVAGFSGDGGPATSAMLAFPNDVAVDGAGDVYVSDIGNQRIRKITLGNGVIRTVAGSSSTPGFGGDGGPATAALLNSPLAVAFDGADNLFIVDRGNSRIRVVTASDGLINTIAGGAAGFSPDGAGAVGARLNLPAGVAADPFGQVVFSDRDNFRIRRIVAAATGDLIPPQVRITSPTTASTLTATSASVTLGGAASDNVRIVAVRWINDRGGSGDAYGIPNWTIPNIPLFTGLNNLTITAWDSSGNSNSASLAITYNPERVIITVAGTGAIGSSGDGGPGVAAQLWLPRAVAFDAVGNVYAVDTQNHRVRKIAPDGTITAFAGSGALGSSGDGGPAAAAAMNEPRGIVFDKAGNAYISDSQNNKVRRVTPDGKISEFAGTGEDDFGGDGGPAKDAHLSFPLGLALDAAGNLYIADANNGRIRRVNASDGKIATIAGNGLVGFDGDGGLARDATLNFSAGVAVDGAGNVYFVDQGNARVRRVNAADGKISTVAGTGAHGFNGDGIPAVNAQINQPRLMTVDAAGDLYIADQGNHRIRKVTVSTGIITTVAGSGAAGSAGDSGSPTAAQLFFPTDVKIDDQGNLYIADGGNQKIRRTVSASTFRTVSSVHAASFNAATGLAPEAIAAAFGMKLATSRQSATTIPLPQVLAGSTLKVKDALGVERLSPMFFADAGQINFQVPQGTASGVATITVTSGDGSISTGTANIASVAPGLFTASMDGLGLVAAVALRVKPSNQVQYEPVIRLDPAANKFVAVPIDLSVEGDRVFLAVFGTGFRGRSALSNALATVGGVNAPVVYAGLAPGLVGLDQGNIQLDRSLTGKGEVDVILTVDGKTANAVRINIK